MDDPGPSRGVEVLADLNDPEHSRERAKEARAAAEQTNRSRTSARCSKAMTKRGRAANPNGRLSFVVGLQLDRDRVFAGSLQRGGDIPQLANCEPEVVIRQSVT